MMIEVFLAANLSLYNMMIEVFLAANLSLSFAEQHIYCKSS